MERFMKVYATIQEYLLEDAVKNMALDPTRRNYLKSMMDTTCLGGKYIRGITVVDIVDTLTKHVEGEEKEAILFEASVCGWMIEMLQAHFLIEDDIMDHSITRRGKPCWYRFPGVTTQSAINDGLIVLAWCTELAYKYFSHRPALAPLLRIFHKGDYQTTMGQLYDVTSMRDAENINAEIPQEVTKTYKDFTFPTWQRIVKFKTAFYTFHLPLAMGLIVCERTGIDAVNPALVEEAAMIMGEYFQAQDDFMDCFTPPEILGKIGTDIQDVKCSWLAVNFLACANEEQVATFKANYGTEEGINSIKELYTATDMKGKFAAYEATMIANLEVVITKIEAESTLFATACREMWNKTHKRTK